MYLFRTFMKNVDSFINKCQTQIRITDRTISFGDNDDFFIPLNPIYVKKSVRIFV